MVQIRRSDYAPQVQPGCPVESASPGTTSEVDHKKELNHDPKTSGATKEAAASKALEHGFEGRAQEAKLRAYQNPTVLVNGRPVEAVPIDHKHEPSMFESTQTQTVQINGKSSHRKSDSKHCGDSKKPIK